MRLWSIHPKYLDSKGLIALWREALLAKHVLEGKTKGYRNHPQLDRFKASVSPIDAINQYLEIVFNESLSRNYVFNKNKFFRSKRKITLSVNEEQLQYEFRHLVEKLKIRDREFLKKIENILSIHSHPIFKIVKGPIESWERIR